MQRRLRFNCIEALGVYVYSARCSSFQSKILMHQNSLELELLSLWKLLTLVVDEWNIKCAGILKFRWSTGRIIRDFLMHIGFSQNGSSNIIYDLYPKVSSHNVTHNLECLCVGCWHQNKQPLHTSMHFHRQVQFMYARPAPDGMTATAARMTYLRRRLTTAKLQAHSFNWKRAQLCHLHNDAGCRRLTKASDRIHQFVHQIIYYVIMRIRSVYMPDPCRPPPE